MDDQGESGLLKNISAIALIWIDDVQLLIRRISLLPIIFSGHLMEMISEFSWTIFGIRKRQIWYRETSYNDLNGVLLSEDNDVFCHSVKSDVTYEVNKDSIYVYNRFHGAWNFDKSYGETTLNGEVSRQNVRPRKHYFTGFQMILPMSKGSNIDFGSSNHIQLLA